MVKTVRLAGMAAIALTVAQAHAQSTVTLYGVVDTGLLYVHNSGGHSTQIAMSSGTLSGPRFGLKGAEDLGGGLKAIFQMENGFNSSTGTLGQGGRMFGRQAYVGLSSATWGTVTAGRQYDPIVDQVQQVSGDWWLGGIFTSPGDIDNADNSIRINNSVKWVSPDWNGLQAEAMYSFGGIAGATGTGQTYSGAASYKNGPLVLAAGYQHINNGNTALTTRGTTSADSLFDSSVNAAYASSRSISITRAGGNYVLGSVTLGGYYSFSQYVPDVASTFQGSQMYHNGEVYAVWQMSPALLGEVGYDYMTSHGNSSAKQHTVSAGLDYNLSKRTDVYGIVSYAHASGENGAGAAQAVIGSMDIDSGSNKQAMLTVGLRHKF